MPMRTVPPVIDNSEVQATGHSTDLHGYTLFSHAIKEAESFTARSARKKFIAAVDRHNTEIIRKVIRTAKQLVVLKEAMSMKMMIEQLESTLALAEEATAIGKEHQELAFVIIDKLVREKRIQKNPAARIGKALRILFSDHDRTIERINEEVHKLNTSTELAEYYVGTISQLNKPELSLQELASVSGYSKAVWSKHLRKDSSMMVAISGRLQNKLNLAKTDDRRELWTKANDVVEQKCIAMTQKIRRNRESSRDMRRYVPTGSDRRKSSGGKGLQAYEERAEGNESASAEEDYTQ
jgi:hypothetical protein